MFWCSSWDTWILLSFALSPRCALYEIPVFLPILFITDALHASSLKTFNRVSSADCVWQRFCSHQWPCIEGQQWKVKYMKWLKPRLKQYAIRKRKGIERWMAFTHVLNSSVSSSGQRLSERSCLKPSHLLKEEIPWSSLSWLVTWVTCNLSLIESFEATGDKIRIRCGQEINLSTISSRHL